MAEHNEALKRINEDFEPVAPDDNIKCKDCVFRKPDIVKGGNVIVNGYKNGYCEVYSPDISRGKPNGILFNGDNCKHYMKDE